MPVAVRWRGITAGEDDGALRVGALDAKLLGRGVDAARLVLRSSSPTV